MRLNSLPLLEELIQLSLAGKQTVLRFKNMDANQLNFKPNEKSWSILECIEHLNLYGDFYLPEMEKQILAASKTRPKVEFKTGVLGGYFANLMREKNGKIKKMKSPKDKNPTNSTLTITSLDRFLKQQSLLISLLEQAKQVDLTKTKTAISISSFIKLRIGDTFRFYVYHIERHLNQAKKLELLLTKPVH